MNYNSWKIIPLDAIFDLEFVSNKTITNKLVQNILKNEDLDVKCLTAYESLLSMLASDSNGKTYSINLERYTPIELRADILNRNSEDFMHPVSKYGDYITDETYLILFMDEDVIKGNLGTYTIGRYIEETGEVFSDGAHITLVNGKYRGDDELGRLLHDLYCADPEEIYDREFAEIFENYLREN